MIDMTTGHTRMILEECQRQSLLRNQTAYVLATAYWETAHTMLPVREAYWLSDEWRERNLRYYPWYGRGYVQLTWQANYEKAGRVLGVDLLTDPDVAMKPDYATKILVTGMREGWFTGKRLAEYVDLDHSNYRGARRVVNGTDKASAIAEIAREYENELLAMDYGVEKRVPITDEARDGRPPRKTITKSKTMQAQVAQFAGLAGPGLAWWQAEDQTIKMLILAGAAVAVVAGFVVFRERLQKWANGDR